MFNMLPTNTYRTYNFIYNSIFKSKPSVKTKNSRHQIHITKCLWNFLGKHYQKTIISYPGLFYRVSATLMKHPKFGQK